MLNDTQQDLLDSYIDNYFIPSAKALIKSSLEPEEQKKATTYIKMALTQSIFDFCKLIMAAYPPTTSSNNKKLLMLMTLNSLINAEAPDLKFVKTICDERLSAVPVEMNRADWHVYQQKLIAQQTKVKMLEWIEAKQPQQSNLAEGPDLLDDIRPKQKPSFPMS